MVIGFAYIAENGEIDIKTVSPTEMAAKVNAIVSQSAGQIIPFNSWPEATINKAFEHVICGEGRIAKVSIAEIKQPPHAP